MSKQRKPGAPGVRSMVTPLPLMVRVEATALPMTGKPLGPSVVLLTPVNR